MIANLLPPISVILVTYYSAATISATLAALRPACEVGLLRCIVIDNDSHDGTREILQLQSTWLDFVPNDDNVGFGRACNQGLSRVETDYVLFLNPDALIAQQDVEALVRFMQQHPRCALAAPAVVSPDGSLQHAGGLPSPWRILRKAATPWRLSPPQLIVPGDEARQVDWVCGAVMIGRTDVIQQLGGFDPRFFLYFEETDLCQRLLSAGHEVWMVGTAKAEHIGAASSQSSGQARVGDCLAQHFFESRFYYLCKHYGYVPAAAAEIGELCLLTARSVGRRLMGRDASPLQNRLAGPVLRLPAPVHGAAAPASPTAGDWPQQPLHTERI